MGANDLCDGGMAGQSGLYPGETMPAMHLPRLMDSSSALGFLNYEVPNTNWMGSQYAHSQYQTSLSASYGSHLIEEVPLTLEDLSRHNVQQDLCRPFRPHPRVGVFGSLLQQDIANLSKNCVCGRQSAGYRLGVAKGTASFDWNRKEDYDVSQKMDQSSDRFGKKIDMCE
jgi:hypothetical protein